MTLDLGVQMHWESARAARHSGPTQPKYLGAAFICCTLSGCWLDVEPASQGAAATDQSTFTSMTSVRWMPRAAREVAKTDSASASSSPPTQSISRTTSSDDDAGIVPTSDAGAAIAAQAGSGSEPVASAGAGAASTTSAEPATVPANTPGNACPRDVLQQRLDAYLDAMAQGAPASLPVHSNLHYTENGQSVMLGRGLWLSQPRARFTRSALDTQSCGSVTHAVLEENLGTTVMLGLRLRYLEDLLIDVETTVARRDPQLFNPDAIIVPPPDPWLASVPDDKRMSNKELVAVAERFFAGIVTPSDSPPRAPMCMLRQNGVQVGGGNCTAGSAAERFQQLRYPVVDPETGLVGAIGLGHSYIVMFLFKVEEGTLINIDAIGGVPSAVTGW
jgi:hypothetical protein